MVDFHFPQIEKEQDFRAEYFYFLALINNYIYSIFWHCFPPINAQKSRRKKFNLLRDVFDEKILNPKFDKEGYLSNAIFPLENRRRLQIDCYAVDFQNLLAGFPPSLQEHFLKNLELEHAIYLDWPSFLRILEELRKKRNYLEHYEDLQVQKQREKGKKYNDEAILKQFGVFLLPHQLHLFLGRIRHYTRKLPDWQQGYDNRKSLQKELKNIDELLNMANMKRRKHTALLYAEKRSKANKDLHKSKRKKLVDANTRWMQAYRQLGMEKSGYRQHNFKRHYYFVGEKNIAKIRLLVKGNIEDNCSFKWDIEPIYDVSMRVNLVLHRYYSRYLERHEKKISNWVKGRKCWSGKKKKKMLKKIKNFRSLRQLRQIRDPIAHNNLFWQISEPEKIFLDMKNIILRYEKPALQKQVLNDFYIQISRIFEKEKFALAKMREYDSLKKINHWSPENREEYKNEDLYDINMRRDVKNIIAKWHKQLRKALQNERKKRKNKCG